MGAMSSPVHEANKRIYRDHWKQSDVAFHAPSTMEASKQATCCVLWLLQGLHVAERRFAAAIGTQPSTYNPQSDITPPGGLAFDGVQLLSTPPLKTRSGHDASVQPHAEPALGHHGAQRAQHGSRSLVQARRGPVLGLHRE